MTDEGCKMIEIMKKEKVILVIFVIAFVLRASVALVTHLGLSAELEDKIIPLDAREYGIAFDILDSWKGNGIFNMKPGSFPAYSYYMAGIIYAVGHNRINVPLVNSLVGALAVFFIYGITRKISSRRAGYISSAIYAFFPSLIFWSSQNLKDTLCIFIIILSIWAAIKLKEPFRLSHMGYLFVILPLLMALNILRSFMFLFLIYGIVFSFLVGISRPTYKKNILYAAIFYIFMCAIPLHAYIGVLSELPLSIHNFLKDKAFIFNFHRFSDLNKDLETAAIKQYGMATGKAAYAVKVDISSPLKALKYLPKGITYFLFAPFPWSAEGLMQKLTIPETLIWYIIFPFVLYGLYIYRSKWKMFFPVLFFTVITLTAYSLIEGNFGTAFRHRAVLMPLFFIFAGAGISEIPVFWPLTLARNKQGQKPE